jgi:integral membrane protein (TIGR01906 family)
MALLGTNVRLAFSSLPVYAYAIDAFDASNRTGVGRDELVQAMRGLIQYFGSSEDLITTTLVTLEGVQEPLFNDREAIHFRDVKSLLNGVYRFQLAAVFVLVTVSAGAAFATFRGDRLVAINLMKGLRYGSYGTIAAVIALGAMAALGAFNRLFVVFHELSFDNDLWQGVSTDRMVQLFPEAFFFQATLLIGLGAVFEASLIAGATTLATRALGKRIAGETREPDEAPSPPETESASQI